MSRFFAVPAVGVLVLALLGQPGLAQSAGSPTATPTGADPVAVQPLPESETGLYVVRFEEPSLAAYTGGVPGLAPTSPSVTGAEHLDSAAPASVAYLDHLAERHQSFEARMEGTLGRGVAVAHTYRHALNGMAVAVDATEAARLAGLPGVADVYPDQVRELTTDVSHEVIGSAAFWDGLTGAGVGTRGEGVVVGMIDSGVNPNHPSFAAVDGEGYVHTNPLGSGNFLGVCDPAHPEHEPICNDKLIGAYNFNPDSPNAQDAADHGSHVGSTIAGNVHEATFPVGAEEQTRTIQGVAPRANVVSFLVCFPGCPNTASVAAVNQAIADGVVDVLNYSISGADDPWSDPVDLAFLDAFAAGIYVSASAGNSGPGPRTVAKTGPWNASVAASTHHRIFAHAVDVTAPPAPELTDLPAFPGNGPQITTDLEADLRFAEDNATGCLPYPAGSLTGAFALIERGGCTFPEKVANAAAAGAVAVIMFNNVGGPPVSPNGLEEALIPAVMLDRDAGQALRDLVVESPDPVQVRVGADVEVVLDPEWADVVAGFSSRGPSQFDLLAPTFAAPGVSILAAARETAAGADNYTIINGTSMASPHGAGAAALLAALHPDWSPAMVRSALAGTADPDVLVKEDGVTPADPYDQGSGRLDLTAAATVGLVLDETAGDFAAADPALGGDPTALNVPSIVDQDCVVECTFTRTVTSVADAPASYTVAVESASLAVSVSPAEFTIAPGGTQQLEITVTGAQPGDGQFADIRLETADQHANGTGIAPVHLPVVAAAAPPTLTLEPEEINSVQGPDEVVSRTLTIGNAGAGTLEWQIAESAQTTLESAGSVEQTGAVTVWDQPPNGTSGIVSDFYSADGSGVYAADDFTVPGEVALDTIHADGFLNAGDLTEATALNWFIYPDAGGVPAGHPEDGQNAHVFTFSTAPDGAGVTIDNDSVTLDLLAATGGAVTLPGGSYWLSVFPDISTPCCAGETRWNWNQGTPLREPAHLIDPGNLFGGGFTDWTSFPDLGLPFAGTAFRLEGTLDCTESEVPWLEVDPTSGSVGEADSQQVEVTLDSTGLAPGPHSAALCLSSNDPDRELTLIPVTLEVEAAAETPAIEVAPAELTAEVPTGEVAEETLTISNTGDGELDWTVGIAPGGAPAEEPGASLVGVQGPLSQGLAAIGAGALLAGGGAQLSATAGSAGGLAGASTGTAAPEDEATPLAVLIEQPSGGTNGIVSDFYNLLGGGVYSADEFILAEPATVELIHADGFWTSGGLATATALNWYVYPDAGGVPAGHPEDGQNAHVWTFSTPPTGAGVDITDNNITLDVVAATGAGIPLPAGTYWLSVFPDINSPTLDGLTRWNWFESAQQGEPAHLVDPTDLFGLGITEWTPFDLVGLTFTGTAFRLEGTEGAVGCTPGEVPWLAADPESGTTPAGGSSDLTVTFDATDLAPGEYTAVVCVSSNDPDRPVVEVPVALTVTENEPPPGPVCDRTVMGVHAGPLTVDAGVTCLAAGARVVGEVNVLPGAGLIGVAAVVQGPLSATGATVVDLSFSQVTGPISIVGTTGRVALFGSQVTGSVLVANNSTGAEPVVVAGNTVIGSLTCNGNAPPPTDHELTNTVVGGGKLGQCAEL